MAISDVGRASPDACLASRSDSSPARDSIGIDPAGRGKRIPLVRLQPRPHSARRCGSAPVFVATALRPPSHSPLCAHCVARAATTSQPCGSRSFSLCRPVIRRLASVPTTNTRPAPRSVGRGGGRLSRCLYEAYRTLDDGDFGNDSWANAFATASGSTAYGQAGYTACRSRSYGRTAHRRATCQRPARVCARRNARCRPRSRR